jgi:hypothetical protein
VSNKKLNIEFIEYDGADKNDRINKGLELLVDFLLRKHAAKNLTNSEDSVKMPKIQDTCNNDFNHREKIV